MRYSFLTLLSVLLITGCNNFGDKVSQDYLEVYYKDGVTKETAQRTLDFLLPEWKNDDGSATTKKSVQLSQRGDTVIFRMVADMKAARELGDDVFLLLASTLSESVYEHAPVNVELTDKSFKTVKALPFEKRSTLGKLVTEGNMEVYISNGGTVADAKRLETYLASFFGTDKRMSAQLSQGTDGSHIVKIVYDKEYAATLPEGTFEDIAAEISRAMGGAPVTLELTDEYFRTYKKFASSMQEINQ